MNFDFAKTLSLIKGGLLDHETTWKSYLEENPTWKQTAMVLAGPLILANIILSVILSRMAGGFSYYSYYGNLFTALFWGLFMGILGFVITVFAFNFLAGQFKGKPDFPRAFAAVSLAAIPSWTAGILAALIPYIGLLIALAGGVISLIFMYKIMPMALNVPDEKRLAHFISSLVSIIILNFVIGSIIGVGAMNSGMHSGALSKGSINSRTTVGSGMLGEFERQGRLMEDAEADTFEPPADGKLSKAQLEKYVKVLQKTRALHEDYAQRMQKFSEDMKAKEAAGEKPSVSDLSQAYAGIGTAMSANNAEMEVVKTGGGNWAEHLWIKEQLRVARIQQGDGSDALEHNYKLYKKYEDELNGN